MKIELDLSLVRRIQAALRAADKDALADEIEECVLAAPRPRVIVNMDNRQPVKSTEIS